MTVSATLISAVGFNNSNFTRYLTATLVTYVPSTSSFIYGNIASNQTVSWNFPTFVTAYTAANLSPSSVYQSGVAATVASVSTLYLAFSATTYNDTTTSYTLCSLPLSCTFVNNLSYTNPVVYTQTFDTFPNINLTTYINYENTNNSLFFYRLTSTKSFPTSASFTSSSFSNLANTAPYYSVSGTINNVLTSFNNLTNVQYFNCSAATVSSIGIVINATSGTNSFAPWYTPHTFTQNLSVNFVPYYLSAGFIGFPDTVFSGANVLCVNSSNYTSPQAALTFLGEGHTANVTLSASSDSRATAYSWNIQDSTNNTSIITPAGTSYTNTSATSYSTITASISTTPAQSNIIPITLQLSDSKYFTLSSNPPIIQYDDNTGKPSYYPFYSSTLDTFGNEATATNNVFHQSIKVTTYDVSSFVLYPNLPNTFPSSVISPNNQIYLPVPVQPFTNTSFGSPLIYNSYLTNISSVNTAPCYDTAGGNLSSNLFWTWAALSSTALNNLNNATYPLSTQSVIPSSWSMTQCLSSVLWNGNSTTLSAISALYTVTSGASGMFAKTWGYQGAGIITPVSPVNLVGGGITWTLFTNNWTYPTITYTNNATTNFSWTLQLSGAGTTTTSTGGTVPLYQNTPVTIQAQQTITATVTGTNSNINYDWQPRSITITPSVTLTSVGLPQPLIYTPNRYVLTGSNIPIQNITTNAYLITAVNLNFDNTTSYLLTGNTYYNTFVVSSCSVGYKNLTLTSYTNYPNLPVIVSPFPNIVDVVSQYDIVNPLEYRSLNSPISLPWPVIPKVGANDWVIADNINSGIKKIYDNLQYLNILSKTYFSGYSDYFGYFSPINYNNVITNNNAATNTAQYCPFWTWQDLNTAITPSNNVTWLSLSGTNCNCGTWLNQTCSFTNATQPVVKTTTSTQYSTSQKIFTSSTNWVVPNGVTSVQVTVIGAGGGGGGGYWPTTALNANGGGGGGSGGYKTSTVSVTPGSTISVKVGIGGKGGAGGTQSGITAGSTGGSSSFGSYITVTGGGGGQPGSATSVGTGGSSGTPSGNPGSNGVITYYGIANFAGGVGGKNAYAPTGTGGVGSDNGQYDGGGIGRQGNNGAVIVQYTQATTTTTSVTSQTPSITYIATPSTYTTSSTATNTVTLTSSQGLVFCNNGTWNVNIPGLDSNYGTVNNGNYVNANCIYKGIVSKNNNIYAVQSTQINLLSSDYLATVYGVVNTTDGKTSFSSIANISLDSSGKIFVLDTNLSQVITFVADSNNNWYEFNNWGGFGFTSSKFKFNTPQDIHIDQLDNVWVCDTGNNAIKQYTNTGSWLLTISDNNLASHPPLSLAVDSQKNVHVLTTNGIFVYDYFGNYQYTYSYSAYATSTNPRRINTSYNREVIYIAFDTQVLKFFRTGTFNGYIIKSLTNVTNINSIYQDEFRNLLVVSDNIILKFSDLMQLTTRQSSLPTQYWSLNDLLIHKEEYVQNWVYNKSFERLWDNIEMFRNTLQYSTGNCLSYTAPLHGKNKMIIGQNEIVTSTTVNRVLGYLWDNFYTLVKYFDPNCTN